MEDKQDAVIARYDLNVRRRYRSRGGWMLETEAGLKLMREYETIRSHFQIENSIKEHLIQGGFTKVDAALPNSDGELVTETEAGEKFVIYNWFPGEECDLRNKSCLTAAGENLGRLHVTVRGYKMEASSHTAGLLELFQKHNRELKRVNSYMKNKKRKTEFEIYAINCFQGFYDKACEAAGRLERCRYYAQVRDRADEVCHGDYNYHNLIMSGGELATTGFEKAGAGIQLLDLTYFLRKTLEKNSWDKSAGEAVLKGYDRAAALTGDQLEFIYIMLAYPEKYWKLMNHYFNKKKSWLSAKSLEKLKDVRSLEKNRENFLKGH